jgi:Tfp pilus assembly protein PilF
MDRKQQAVRIQRIVEAIVQRALEVPPDNRPAYIKNEIAKVREAFRQTYEADERLTASAMEFVDSMYSWIKARAKSLELGGNMAKDI